MNWNEYVDYFNQILEGKINTAPYDDEHFMEYTKLNISRMNRWLKQGKLNEALLEKLQQQQEMQTWILITEPWCGDAAHIVPFIYLLSEQCQNVTLKLQLRDTDSEIEKYLTEGSKSIPKFIIRDANNKDLLVWGPRPKNAQAYFMELKSTETDVVKQKTALQQWYNQDKGVSLQLEMLELL
jgi:hypothetical protein